MGLEQISLLLAQATGRKQNGGDPLDAHHRMAGITRRGQPVGCVAPVVDEHHHILHFQARDVMIDRDGLYERGSLSGGIGWQIPRIPGLGDAPWPEIFRELYRTGYDGPIIIEHEDKVFEGTDEKIKRGFLVARDQLRPFIR